jgi:D-glycero-alpha-D-manno-heptose-7-phosphate kinase
VSHASAPVRLDFAGGWTDVAPYATEVGGVVVNSAIELRATASVETADGYELRSDDLDRVLHPREPADFEPNGELDLLKAAVRVSGIGPCRIHTRSEAPPGSGLGSSGALDVALVAALAAYAGEGLTAIEAAERAWRLEAVEAALPGGKQDQYAAALGGFHRFDFSAEGVAVRSLRLDAAFRSELARRVVICYTGRSRLSSDTIARVMNAFVRKDVVVMGALRGLAEVAEAMAEALEASDLGRIGTLLSRNWVLQQALDPAMATPEMTRLERTMREAGAVGGKAAGAGAGGSMFFVMGGDPALGRQAAEAAGVTVLPARWATEGIRTW